MVVAILSISIAKAYHPAGHKFYENYYAALAQYKILYSIIILERFKSNNFHFFSKYPKHE